MLKKKPWQCLDAISNASQGGRCVGRTGEHCLQAGKSHCLEISRESRYYMYNRPHVNDILNIFE